MTVIIYATDPLGEVKHVNAYDGHAKLEGKPKQQTQARKPSKNPQLLNSSEAFPSLLKEYTAKEKTPTKNNTAGDPKREQLVLPVFWQKTQLQEVFCS